jgi:hypothetical protein
VDPDRAAQVCLLLHFGMPLYVPWPSVGLCPVVLHSIATTEVRFSMILFLVLWSYVLSLFFVLFDCKRI